MHAPQGTVGLEVVVARPRLGQLGAPRHDEAVTEAGLDTWQWNARHPQPHLAGRVDEDGGDAPAAIRCGRCGREIPLTITEAMALEEVASPATIHRKIDDLRIAGLVDTEFQGENRRTKYLTPTPKARKFFDKVNALLPSAAYQLVRRGHRVVVETQAGAGSGFPDEEYRGAGAELVADRKEVFAQADMIVKVKEPQPAEIKRLKKGQTLFTYLHLAPDPEQTKGLLDAGIVGIVDHYSVSHPSAKAPAGQS